MSKIEFQKDGIFVGENGEFYKLSDIILKCNSARIKDENLAILKIAWRGWRGFGGLKEEIVLPASNIEVIKKYILGKEICFGEINGKHSDIYNTVDENDIEIISNEELVALFLSENPSGHSYEHSFIYQFYEQLMEDQHDDMNDIQIDEYTKALPEGNHVY